ncbi:S10 family peptidase [Novosphingobium terrae]|uniref:S10 family peptidase n=1 Tax=Novosphingobium terrae TaxID=2726189 RepID=UPI001981E624|nr:peptidase S10 [Novosphingobium terrae]
MLPSSLSRGVILALSLGMAGAQPVAAQEAAPTHHQGTFHGKPLTYDAALDTIDIPGTDGQPGARLKSFTYTLPHAAPGRPVMFLFNGGPIVPSHYIHMGAFGPRRLALPDPSDTAGTASLVDNPDSPLDVADLVFIDPAQTGFSTMAPGGDPRRYFSVEADGRQVTAFIEHWLDAYGRRESPVYIVGESYGTLRAAAVAGQLVDLPRPIHPAGVMLLGQALNIVETAQRPNNLIGYAVAMPTLTAIAAYHHLIDLHGKSLDTLMAESWAFASGPYLTALMQGDTLPPAQAASIARHLAELTGISARYYLDHRLRITKEDYRRTALADRHLVLGADDARYVTPDKGKDTADASQRVQVQFDEGFRRYRTQELGIAEGADYVTGSPVKGLDDWDWGGRSPFGDWPFSAAITHAFSRDPALKVMVVTGTYDTLTTPGASRLMVNQAGWPAARVKQVALPGGHMFYTVPASEKAFMADVHDFITKDLP